MSAPAISQRYSFGERVYDATQDEHDKCLGFGCVAVVSADYTACEITVSYHVSTAIARQWVAVEQWQDPSIDHHIVGDDVRE